jgi:hypothetical protein
MPRLGVNVFSLSLDGYGAGLDQNIDDPLGEHGLQLHEWMFPREPFARWRGWEGADRQVSMTTHPFLSAQGSACSTGSESVLISTSAPSWSPPRQ